MEKSRIIATLALLVIFHTSRKKVHILVPNEALVGQDSNKFEEYFKLSGFKFIVYNKKPNLDLGQTDIVLDEEADYFILKNPGLFTTCLKKLNRVLHCHSSKGRRKLRWARNTWRPQFTLFQFRLSYWDRMDKLSVNKILKPMDEQQLTDLAVKFHRSMHYLPIVKKRSWTHFQSFKSNTWSWMTKLNP